MGAPTTDHLAHITVSALRAGFTGDVDARRALIAGLDVDEARGALEVAIGMLSASIVNDYVRGFAPPPLERIDAMRAQIAALSAEADEIGGLE